ncbi:MAG: hypothetical protein K9N34_10825 [Candidatus Marinimicrobia bacterium]|nr:hypothetical protein [Candidatus Neomarinimicrobiota bacterium]
MSLLACPECKKKISDTTDTCPNCGYQLTPEKISEIKEEEKKKKRGCGIGCLSIIVIIIILGIIGSLNEINCNDFSGTYSGTSEMGFTTGTAKIKINNDCSATLTYYQGSMGGETEKGEIIKDGDSYKFKSTGGGGTYNLKISTNKIILEGYNWRCVMTK